MKYSNLKAVLFDLDGTLLPMDNAEFTKGYFKLLAARLAPLGYEPKQLVDAVWAGTAAMVKNDGSRSNEAAFWARFTESYGERALQDLPVLVSGPFAPGAEETLLQMGADDFLAKPYNDTPLLHHVRGVLARRRFSYSRSEEQRRLEDAANQDYLTGVLNRRGLDQAVEQMELEGRQGMNALYVLDLDDLKGANDRHGHLYGDKKIRAFADYLTSCLRAEDLVARIGGDEFIILMRQMPSAEVARQQGQRLCRDLERKSGVDGEKISCSAGVAIFRGMAELQQALVRADQALYQAKRQGKGRCCLWQPESPA